MTCKIVNSTKYLRKISLFEDCMVVKFEVFAQILNIGIVFVI